MALSALVSYWRRRPLQLVLLLLGLSMATALWSGVQAINTEARTSYDRAAAIAGRDGASRRWRRARCGGGRFAFISSASSR